MKAGELIISLAEAGAVEMTDEAKKVIEEVTLDLPDEFAAQLKGSLFTVESALANPDIINKLKAESLDAVDQKMVEFATDFGLDDGFKHNLKEIKGTYNRIDSIKKAVLANQKLALEKAKEGAPAGDQEELQKEITKLNTQIASHTDSTVSKTDHQDVIDGYEDMLTENAKAMLQLKSNSLFVGQNYAMEVDPEINITTAQTLFAAELASKNINLVDDNNTLKLQTQEGTPYFVDNKEVTPQDFANTLLAGKKLLKVTDSSSPASTPTTPTTIVGGDGLDASVIAALAKAKASNDAIQELQGKTV